MRTFNYSGLPAELISPTSIRLNAEVHELKGRFDFLREYRPDIVEHRDTEAILESTASSTRLEGIHISDERIGELVSSSASPRNRTEEEVLGFSKLSAKISDDYEHISPAPSFIRNMHRDLYEHTDIPYGGEYRRRDTIFTRTDGEVQSVPVSPVSAYEVPLFMGAICDAYLDAVETHGIEPLTLIPILVVDFLCIHPFNEGNGRLSRLLIELLLCRSGHTIVRYSSMDRVFEKTSREYYDTINLCTFDWEKGRNTYLPFVRYFNSSLKATYDDVLTLMSGHHGTRRSKSGRVKALFDERVGKTTKREIIELCPDISLATIELTLGQLVREGYLLKLDAGKNTGYIKNKGV